MNVTFFVYKIVFVNSKEMIKQMFLQQGVALVLTNHIEPVINLTLTYKAWFGYRLKFLCYKFREIMVNLKIPKQYFVHNVMVKYNKIIPDEKSVRRLPWHSPVRWPPSSCGLPHPSWSSQPHGTLCGYCNTAQVYQSPWPRNWWK